MLQGIIILTLSLLYSCSRVSVRQASEPEVTVDAAVNQARSSYLRGCVDAFHHLKVPKAFDHCLENAKLHEKELLEILHQPIPLP